MYVDGAKYVIEERNEIVSPFVSLCFLGLPDEQAEFARDSSLGCGEDRELAYSILLFGSNSLRIW